MTIKKLMSGIGVFVPLALLSFGIVMFCTHLANDIEEQTEKVRLEDRRLRLEIQLLEQQLGIETKSVLEDEAHE